MPSLAVGPGCPCPPPPWAKAGLLFEILKGPKGFRCARANRAGPRPFALNFEPYTAPPKAGAPPPPLLKCGIQVNPSKSSLKPRLRILAVSDGHAAISAAIVGDCPSVLGELKNRLILPAFRSILDQRLERARQGPPFGTQVKKSKRILCGGKKLRRSLQREHRILMSLGLNLARWRGLWAGWPPCSPCCS